MKKILIFFAGAFLVASCAKEAALTPTTPVNYFARTSTPDMDEVDELIYQIWVKYQIGIVYDSVIGFEGNGHFDPEGNPIGREIIVSPRRTINTSTEKNTSILYTTKQVVDSLDTSSDDAIVAANKREFLPLLQYLDQKLLPMVKGCEFMNFPTGIYLVETLTQNSIPKSALRTMDCICMARAAFNPSNPATIMGDFLSAAFTTSLDPLLGTYYGIVEKSTNAGSNSWTPDRSLPKTLGSIISTFGTSPSGNTGTSTDWKDKDKAPSIYGYLSAVNSSQLLTASNGNGATTTGTVVLPMKTVEFSLFMELVFTYSVDDFKNQLSYFSRYTGRPDTRLTEIPQVNFSYYPKVVERFEELRRVLKSIDFDPDAFINQ